METPCAGVAKTLKVIGGKWKPMIMYHLRGEPVRYLVLLRATSGITQKMLTQQLRELEHDGLILRRVYPVVPPHVEYQLTKKGQTLLPLLESMAVWGVAH